MEFIVQAACAADFANAQSEGDRDLFGCGLLLRHLLGFPFRQFLRKVGDGRGRHGRVLRGAAAACSALPDGDTLEPLARPRPRGLGSAGDLDLVRYARRLEDGPTPLLAGGTCRLRAGALFGVFSARDNAARPACTSVYCAGGLSADSREGSLSRGARANVGGSPRTSSGGRGRRRRQLGQAVKTSPEGEFPSRSGCSFALDAWNSTHRIESCR